MSGKCYSCATSFNVFRKEHGCKNCGFSFCSECVKHKAQVPKRNNETHKVCSKCYDILTGKAKPVDQAKYSPPEAYKKLVASRDEQSSRSSRGQTSHQAPPRHNYSPSRGASKPHGLSKEDAVLAERLNKLKEDRKKAVGPIPSQKEMEERLQKLKEDPNALPKQTQSEMEARLAKLKGQDPSQASRPHVFATDKRSEQQQIDDLLEEICAEVEIDSQHDAPGGEHDTQLNQANNNLNKPSSSDAKNYTKNIPGFDDQRVTDEEIQEMNRLAAQIASDAEVDAQVTLDGVKKTRSTGANEATEGEREGGVAEDVSDEENDEDAAKAVLEQVLAEQKLEERLDDIELGADQSIEKGVPDPPGDLIDTDELPWCCICNEDAALRCRGCDDDLYCRRCYRQGHDPEDMEDHTAVPYKPPK